MGVQGLFVAAFVGGALLPAQGGLAATEGQLVRTKLVRTTSTADWRFPSSDPTGITYDGKRLLIADGEVNEGVLWRRANLFIATKRGALQRTRTLAKASLDPEGILWHRKAKVLFVADDDRKAIFRFRRGRDRAIGTRDDKVRKFVDTRRFGSHDPEGLAWHGWRKMLIWVDGGNATVYTLRRGSDRRFGTRDDKVRRFRTSRYGVTQLEGVTFDPASRHLFLVSSKEKFVVETTMRGWPVRTIELPFCKSRCNLTDLVFAPGSDGSRRNLYLTDAGKDNNDHPHAADYNDGKLYEVSLVP